MMERHAVIQNTEISLDKLMQLNIKLREDLTKSFQSYINLLSTTDELKK